MFIWNLKRLMSFRDNDLKDACLPILAPVIDQIWSVVLANPGRHVIGICTVAGVTGDRGVNTAELPLGFHSSAHLLFFCSPISPLWSAHQFLCSMTSTVLDHMSYSLITIAIDLGIYIFTWIRMFEKLERRRVFGRSTPVVVKQIPRLFTLSCLLSWLFLQPHRTAHSHLDHEL